jgi:hypothetical protein
MSKFTFVCENNFLNNPTKNTTEIVADLLPQVVEEFENFLRGCGYHFDGHLDFVDDE